MVAVVKFLCGPLGKIVCGAADSIYSNNWEARRPLPVKTVGEKGGKEHGEMRDGEPKKKERTLFSKL